MLTMAVLLAGAVLAFLLEFSEFMVLSYTSGLTLSVAGIFKVGWWSSGGGLFEKGCCKVGGKGECGGFISIL